MAGVGDIVDVNPHYKHAAKILDDCDFVEGHRCLSPTTRDRFLDWGTIKWDPAAKRHVGPVSQVVGDEGDVTGLMK